MLDQLTVLAIEIIHISPKMVLGGAAAVDLAVEKFYEKVLADQRVQHFFAHIDMHQQKQHQKAFMTYAFGGAPHWDGRPMREAHQNLVAEMG
jgi:hemoglobin